jgi:single-strand DNA-binding protein
MAQSGYVQITLVGNVGQAPEKKSLESGTTVTTISVAYTSRDDVTTWYRVSSFGKLAEIVAQFVTKGRQVLVVGELNPRTYRGKDGTDKTSLEIRATEVRMLGRKDDGESEAPRATARPSKAAAKQAADDEFLPF